MLERARDDVFNRSYDVIRTPDEIPFTQRPRIVKLHGSFPAHHPLVFTEDDYRTYPVTHAPFVNLVQQSMMETLFCLIGFSGDDPNFLHWAGWVKDNLGQSAPRIYLIGWLDISNHRRRMLEARNVMPIDLAALPAAADWPIDLRHRYANEWFLSALEGGERYNPSNWPARPPRDAHPANPLLGELPMLHQAVPIDTAWSPKDPDAGQGLMTQVAAWRHNRQVYPGWLVAPNHVRNDLWQRSERWFNSLTEISELTPRQRLEAFVEVAWILDRCLFPLFQNLESSAFEALEAVNLQLRLVGEEAITDFDEWRDLLAMSDGLALSLARNGRHANNRDLFDRALDWLKQRALHDPKLNNAITHELCLWDSAAGDLNRLSSRLGDWTSTDNDALWLLRKAGFLAELGEDGRACETLEHALGSVRRGRRRDVDDIPALSIESWAMYLALAYDRRWRDQETEPVLSPDQPRPFDRWRVLGELDCNAWIEIQELTKTLQSRQKSTPAVTERRGFDLYHVATTHHLGSGTPESQRAAYAVLMISELTGIPPAARNVTLLESALTEAAQVLAEDEPWMAAHLAARMHMSSSKQDTLIDRRWVARLADLTYIPTGEGWLYLAAILDMHTRKIVGWSMRQTLHTEIALDALNMAVERQRPAPGLIHHSDRGIQYAAEAYRLALARSGITPSMSRKGDCWDNAPMESFFHTLKTERVHHRVYATRDQARRDLFGYIEGFYNPRRLHSSLGYISPAEAERRAA